MSIAEWRAIAIFGLGIYALSFVSVNAALFTLLAVGVAAFVTRAAKLPAIAPKG